MMALLGKVSDDPAVVELLAGCGIRKRPRLACGKDACCCDDEADFCVWISAKKKGIEFGFEDEGHFLALDRPVGDGPLLFTQIIFYNRREGDNRVVRPYEGALPYGISFSDDRKAVLEKLREFEACRRSYFRDVWEWPDRRLIVSYSADGTRVADVIIQLRRRPSPPLSEKLPRLPTVGEITAFFGTRPSDEKFLEAFTPLGIMDQVEDIVDDEEVDLRGECGLELGFDITLGGNPAGPKRFGMISAIYYGDRVYEARGWAGELPCGLSFDDDQLMLFGKVGIPPKVHKDYLADGYALWYLPEYVLKVLYSNMENRLLRVSIVPQWYREDVEEGDEDDDG